MHNLSITAIFNCYQRSLPGSAMLDHFSIASLVRTVIDASLMTMYISYPGLNRNAWNFRRYVLYLNDLTNRKRFLQVSDDFQHPFFVTYPERKASVQEKIKQFSKTLRISEEKVTELLKGQTVFVEGARGAVREAGWDVKQYDFYQSYLSAFVHSHPVSFIRADEQQISFSDPSYFKLTFCRHMIGASIYYTQTV